MKQLDWRSALHRGVRARRSALGLSLENLADASGVGKSTLVDIENGRIGAAGPGIGTVLRIAAALQTTPDVLCGLASEPLPALIDLDAVELVDRARSLQELEAIHDLPPRRFGILVSDRFRFATAEDLAAAEQRCNAKIARIYLGAED